ncbi:MAG: hypothetical protein V4557_10150 [Bacteroidota bacterium]
MNRIILLAVFVGIAFCSNAQQKNIVTIKEIIADPTPMLYVINDKITGTDKTVLKNIRSTDIKSIKKVTEPTATAVYGTRAANGVVLITTVNYKKKTRIS